MHTLLRHLFVSLAFLGSALAAAQPNIILVMADDLGWGDVGFNGNNVIQTPHLDAMAANGLRFTRFYSGSPVCSPTRGACLTGRNPYRYGIPGANSGHMLARELTLAEVLKAEGYRTGHFGKWHLGTLTKTVKDANRGGPKGAAHFSPPSQNGFDVNFSTESKVPTWDPMRKPPNARRTWWDPVDPATAQPYNTRYWDENNTQVTDNLEGSDSRAIMDRAIPFIEHSAKAKAPFFAVVWFHAPHLPVVAGPKHAALYADQPGYHKHYYGCITDLDEQVGRLRKSLRDLGIADDTMLWFASDNGPEGNDTAPGSAGKFRGRKRSLHEGGVRVPGLLEWPSRISKASTTDFPAIVSDYLPTILDTLGMELPKPRPLDGISLLPVIDGELKVRSSPIGFQYGKSQSLVTQRHKLIRNGRNTALYDLLADPREQTNLTAKNPDLVARLASELDTWVASCRKSASGADETRSAAHPGPLLRFGAIADCQYADANSSGKRLYRLADGKLERAVDELNQHKLDFVVHLGDFIDRDYKSFDRVSPIYDRLKAPHYHVLGNHDFAVADEYKALVPKRLGLPARYYDYVVKGWRFIAIDGNELSNIAYPKGSKRWKKSEAYRIGRNPKLPTYCGGVDQEQFTWLKSRLELARKAGERVILFCHFPIAPDSISHNLWNSDEMLAVLKPYNDIVVAWINGHNHDGNYARQAGIHCLTLKGMLDTKQSAFSVVEIHNDHLQVTGHGRQPDHRLTLVPREKR